MSFSVYIWRKWSAAGSPSVTEKLSEAFAFDVSPATQHALFLWAVGLLVVWWQTTFLCIPFIPHHIHIKKNHLFSFCFIFSDNNLLAVRKPSDLSKNVRTYFNKLLREISSKLFSSSLLAGLFAHVFGRSNRMIKMYHSFPAFLHLSVWAMSPSKAPGPADSVAAQVGQSLVEVFLGGMTTIGCDPQV